MAFPTRSTTVQKPQPKLPPGKTAADTGAADDDAAFWAENARGQLPAPFGEWAAGAIEQCGRTKKSGKLIPGAPACEALERMGQSGEWAVLPPTRQSLEPLAKSVFGRVFA